MRAALNSLQRFCLQGLAFGSIPRLDGCRAETILFTLQREEVVAERPFRAVKRMLLQSGLQPWWRLSSFADIESGQSARKSGMADIPLLARWRLPEIGEPYQGARELDERVATDVKVFQVSEFSDGIRDSGKPVATEV